MKDEDIALAISETRDSLEASRDTLRELSNELASVVDVIEPALAETVKRIRQARMTTLVEVQAITSALKDMRSTLLAKETSQAIEQGIRLISVCRELDDLRTSGALDFYARPRSV